MVKTLEIPIPDKTHITGARTNIKRTITPLKIERKLVYKKIFWKISYGKIY
jgi:hypothetical protein